VRVKDVNGKVKEIGLVYTTLTSKKGDIEVPNSILIKEKIFVK
jgi:hypothetical protein